MSSAWIERLETARFYAAAFADSEVTAICKASGDYPSGKEGDILTVEFTVCGIPCLGFNGGPQFSHTDAFSFQIATDTQEETDRYWNAIVSNGGEESACGWCKDRRGISWQITPRVLMEALAAGCATTMATYWALSLKPSGKWRCSAMVTALFLKPKGKVTAKILTPIQLRRNPLAPRSRCDAHFTVECAGEGGFRLVAYALGDLGNGVGGLAQLLASQQHSPAREVAQWR